MSKVFANSATRTEFTMMRFPRSSEEYKIVGDPAATGAQGAQAPDAPVRPTVAENVTSDKGEEVLPPEGPGAQRGSGASKDKAETSERSSARRRSCKESLTDLRRSARP